MLSYCLLMLEFVAQYLYLYLYNFKNNTETHRALICRFCSSFNCLQEHANIPSAVTITFHAVFLLLTVFNLELMNSLLALSRSCGNDYFLLNTMAKTQSLLEENSVISEGIIRSEI